MTEPSRPPLTIALAQPLLATRDLESNAAVHAEAIRAAGARLVVFPELSLTSYALDAPTVPFDHPVWALVTEACAAAGAVALVGAPIADPDGREYIATVSVDRGGPHPVYRKINTHGAERSRFTAGRGPVVFELDGRRLGLAICRDTSVDGHIADTAALGIDAYIGGSLDTPDGARRRDERMAKIAAEYGVWVAMSCFAGPGGDFGETAGGSAVWAPGGSLVARSDDEPGRIVTATLT